MENSSVSEHLATYGNPPISLINWAKQNQDKIREIGDETGTDDGYWIYFKPGWQLDRIHCIHEYTIQDVKRAFKGVKHCACVDCE